MYPRPKKGLGLIFLHYDGLFFREWTGKVIALKGPHLDAPSCKVKLQDLELTSPMEVDRPRVGLFHGADLVYLPDGGLFAVNDPEILACTPQIHEPLRIPPLGKELSPHMGLYQNSSREHLIGLFEDHWGIS